MASRCDGESATDSTAQAIAEIEGALRRWSAEGPPSMFRASAGNLADKLHKATIDSQAAAQHAQSEKAKLDALLRQNELLQMRVEDLTCHSRLLTEKLESQRVSDEKREAQWLLEREAERALNAHQQEKMLAQMQAAQLPVVEREAMLRSEIEALMPVRAEVAKLRIQEAALCSQLVSVLSPVNVMCRTRPMRSFCDASCSRSALTIDGGEIMVEEARGRQRKFRVDRVLDESATQEDTFTASAPWVENVALGGSSCIFAYGATGAGKTHTLLGGGPNGPQGLAHHAIRKLIEGKGGGEVHISMLEVYCDQIRDLLADPCTSTLPGETVVGPPSLQCSRRDAQGRMVLDCATFPASTCAKADAVLRSGFKHRATEGTRCNDASSRSHVVLTIRTQSMGRLVLVDLAGSENVQRSGADEGGKLLVEAKAINKSLSALADVVEAIAKQQAFVPYRNTRLTMLLEETLCVSKVLFLVHVSPLVANAIDSGHSLQFASRVQAIDFGAQRMRQDQEERLKASQLRSQQEIRQLQAEVEKVKKERDDANKVCQETRQQLAHREQQRRQTPPPRRPEEDELVQRLRREVASLTEQMKATRATHHDDSGNLPSRPSPRPEFPRGGDRIRTPTPPVRIRANKPCVSLSANSTIRTTSTNIAPIAASTTARMPLSDVTNSVSDAPRDAIKACTKMAAAGPDPVSPTKNVVKVDTVSPARCRSPHAAENAGDAADMAAGGSSPIHHIRCSPSAVTFMPRSPQSVSLLPALEMALGEEENKSEKENKLKIYNGVPVKSALKASPSCRSNRTGKIEESGVQQVLEVRRAHFSEEKPVPHSPPKWYMDHLDAIRHPTPTIPEQPRQITPPPRKREATVRIGLPEPSSLPRWRS